MDDNDNGAAPTPHPRDPDETDPEWVELGSVRADIDAAQAEVERLKERRNVLFGALLAKGYLQAPVAKQGGMSTLGMVFAVDPSKKKRQPAGTARAKKAAAR